MSISSGSSTRTPIDESLLNGALDEFVGLVDQFGYVDQLGYIGGVFDRLVTVYRFAIANHYKPEIAPLLELLGKSIEGERDCA
jgi:hypothetical protein